MKKIIISVVLCVGLVLAASAESLTTADLGFMMAGIDTNDYTYYQNSLVLNSTFYIGDTLNFFASASIGILLTYDRYDKAAAQMDYFSPNTADYRFAADLLVGAAVRLDLGEGLKLYAGGGGHLYLSDFSYYPYDFFYITAGLGAFASVIITIDEGIGLHIGFRGALDFLVLAAPGNQRETFITAYTIVPHIGMAIGL